MEKYFASCHKNKTTLSYRTGVAKKWLMQIACNNITQHSGSLHVHNAEHE